MHGTQSLLDISTLLAQYDGASFYRPRKTEVSLQLYWPNWALKEVGGGGRGKYIEGFQNYVQKAERVESKFDSYIEKRNTDSGRVKLLS